MERSEVLATSQAAVILHGWVVEAGGRKEGLKGGCAFVLLLTAEKGLAFLAKDRVVPVVCAALCRVEWGASEMCWARALPASFGIEVCKAGGGASCQAKRPGTLRSLRLAMEGH